MNEIPLARTTMVHALRYQGDLLIYVEGVTSGFGGRLVVERSLLTIHPPEFVVRHYPGNTGITGNAPDEVPTVGAYSFANAGGAGTDAILLRDAEGRREVKVVEVEAGMEGMESEPFTGGGVMAEKPSHIVIALTGGGGEKYVGCRVIPEGTPYPAINSQVYGPASREECEEWMKNNCGFDGGDPPAPV